MRDSVARERILALEDRMMRIEIKQKSFEDCAISMTMKATAGMLRTLLEKYNLRKKKGV
jgi:hypothetical protein